MRSRDGDQSFLFRYCSLIISLLYFSSVLFADEYLISYRYVVKDAVVYNQSLQIAPAMQKCNGTEESFIVLDPSASHNLHHIISLKNEKFMHYLHKLGLLVQHTDTTLNMQNHSTTVLTMPTRCFKVDFNDTFVKISALKQL